MNQSLVDKIVQAVLYEGYILYPYRPSVKNHQRWTFGGLFPRAYSEAYPFGDAWLLQTECLLVGSTETEVDAKVRFLHLTDRKVGQFLQPIARLSEEIEPACLPVASLKVNGKQYHSWQEAVERDIAMQPARIGELLDAPARYDFVFDASRRLEPLPDADGQIAGLLAREQQAIEGSVDASATKVANGVFKLTVRVWNRTPMELPAVARQTTTPSAGAEELSVRTSPDTRGVPPTRDEALMRSLVSTHAILGIRNGQFVSMTDPPGDLQEAVKECQNIGVWPVLVGEKGEKDAILASPIILYDYPEIAPESPGDLFDGTEIDEILTLRVMTLTDDEKRDVAAVDERAGAMLKRTEALAREQLMGLHGTVRGLRPLTDRSSDLNVLEGKALMPVFAENVESVPGETGRMPSGDVMPAWDVLEDKPKLPSFRAGGVDLRPGDRVRLRPRGGADAFDMILAGKTATIVAIEQDYEDRIHIAVTVEDDPGADFGAQGKPAHRFFFRPDEVEPVTEIVALVPSPGTPGEG